jgi:ABC-2 type transport system ATP-binding protein
MNAIVVKNLTKTFGKIKALDNISFTVKQGSVTGFLGPNGAGKSTAMNTLLGFIRPTSADKVAVLGKPVVIDQPAVRRNVGFLSANMALDPTLTAEQEIRYLSELSGRYDPKQLQQLADRLSLDLSAKVGSLSTGNHQKVALIAALVGNPQLLILDEPTNGLDPLVQDEFNHIIKSLKKSGSTIFISSHILSEVDQLCDDFIFIRSGQIVATRTRAELGRAHDTQVTLSNYDFRKVQKFMKSAKIKYRSEPVHDLTDEFMSYYKEAK